MSRCVIIAGADIKDYDWVNEHLSVDDFFVYCDSGLKHLEQINHEPDLIVGDLIPMKNQILILRRLPFHVRRMIQIHFLL